MRPEPSAFILSLVAVVVVFGCNHAATTDDGTASEGEGFCPDRHVLVSVPDVPHRGTAQGTCRVRSRITNLWTKPIYCDTASALSYEISEYQLKPAAQESLQWHANGPIISLVDTFEDRTVRLNPGESCDVDTYVRLSKYAPVACVNIGLRVGQSEDRLDHNVQWRVVILVEGSAAEDVQL